MLLVGCLASFAYLQDQTQAIEAKRVSLIEGDTLSSQIARKAVTILDLQRQPKRFDSQSVWVRGYLHLEFEGDGLYWRKADYQNQTYINSVRVHFADSLAQTKALAEYSDHYVVLKGTFNPTLTNLESGAIIEITSLNALQKSSQPISLRLH